MKTTKTSTRKDEGPERDFLADEHADDDALAEGDDRDDRRHRELDRRRQAEADLDAEQQAQILKERYGRNRAVATDAVVIPQRLLLPSVDDPTIWGIGCKPGKEKEVVYGIQKRIEERAFSAEPIQITAAFYREGTMAGYVYIESRRKADVSTAVDGIPNAYPHSKTILVPINEMPDLLRVRPTKLLSSGMYVRIKRGKYQGDLAQVEEVESNGLEVEVRLIPREDYGLAEDSNAPLSSSMIGSPPKRKRAIGKKSFNRPPQKFFSEIEARKRHARYVQQLNSFHEKQFSYLGNTYVNGFLIKSFKVQLLQVEDVNHNLKRYLNLHHERKMAQRIWI